MFPFDVILFDVGGVLLTNGWDHCERAAVLNHFDLEIAEFEKRHPEPNNAWERDLIDAASILLGHERHPAQGRLIVVAALLRSFGQSNWLALQPLVRDCL